MSVGNIWQADGQFDNALYFNVNDDKLKFDNRLIDNAYESYGSASGFLRLYLKFRSALLGGL